MISEEDFSLRYTFSFPDGREKEFNVVLNKATCELVQETREVYPEWTLLEYRQCAHCPLNKKEHSHCPVAVSIVDIVEFFNDSKSIERADVTVETEERKIVKDNAPLFPAISSLIGIHMVSSGCPIMDKLRPMVRFHLPFASMDETIYRALSMYVLAQYFRAKQGLESDKDLEGLGEIYKAINELNLAFRDRLKNESSSDATANAITSLDCFAQIIDFSISEEMMDDIAQLFQGYL